MIEHDLNAALRIVQPRSYPLVAPRDAPLPYVLYSRVSTRRLNDFDGPSGLAMATFRVDVYAKGFDEARELANKVRKQLDGKQTATYSITLEQERDLSDLTSVPDLYRVNLEFLITHEE